MRKGNEKRISPYPRVEETDKQRVYRNKNKDKVKKWDRKKVERNRAKYNERQRRYRANHLDSAKSRRNKYYSAHSTLELARGYFLRITGTSKGIPAILIHLKEQHIILLRKIKQIKEKQNGKTEKRG
jgi:hypothetical protein